MSNQNQSSFKKAFLEDLLIEHLQSTGEMEYETKRKDVDFMWNVGSDVMVLWEQKSVKKNSSHPLPNGQSFLCEKQ